MGSHGVLGFGLTYSLGDLKAGHINAGGRSVDFKLKDLYSLYIEPGYGLGIRTLLDRNLYLQIEYTQADYNRKTPDFGTYRPMTTTGSIGLGFKF